MSKVRVSKRLIAFFLVLLLVSGMCAGFAAGTGRDLPKPGESVYGFVLKETRAFHLAGAQVLYFEHEKTGAKLVYIANSDTNRVFDLTFLTAATDNTGTPHVFEHAALRGSEKYPDPNLFFNLLYQTYNTYMNAETGPSYTTYPVSSLSEAQLLCYADFYLDSCLHPNVLEDESIFRQEAWRYRLEDADAPLTIEGTVYSEMQAAANLYQTSYYNMLRTAFPGSVCGNMSGGVPEEIPDMTWESLKEYHAQFYHPSNCVAYLYGKFDDYSAFLKLLDEVFSGYDRRETVFEDDKWEPVHGLTEATFAYPAENGTETDYAADMYYVFLCPGLKDDPHEELILNTLTDLLAADSSPVSQSMSDALPGAFVSTWISMGTPEDAIVFSVSGISSEDAHTARDAIEEGIRKAAEEGFSQNLVDALTASLDMNMRLSREDTALGLRLLTGQMIPYYAETGRVFDFLDYAEALRSIRDWNQSGIYREAITQWLLNCETRVLTVTAPEPGLREELNAAEAQRLAEIKAAMSPEEIRELTESPLEDDTDEGSGDLVQQLQAVAVRSLPEEIREYTISDETLPDGTRRLETPADVDDVGMPVILLDAAWVPQDDLHWFVLYLSLLGQLDTEEHRSDELQDLTARYLYGAEIRQSLIDRYGTKEYHPWLRAGWLSTEGDLEKGYGLLYELLFETDFRDYEALAGLIERNQTGLKSLLEYSAYNTMMYRMLGAESPMYAYYSYCNGLDYYRFLEQTAEAVREDPAKVAAKLEEIRDGFCNRTNAISIFAGTDSMFELNRTCTEQFFEKLGSKPVEAVEYSFEEPAMSEALVVDETVQYNGLVGSFEDMGLSGYTADLDAVASLVTDFCLIPKLRDEYGVYTPMHYYDSFAGTYLISYRDPNIKETFEVYDELPELIASEEFDQETLDGYILSCYSAYAMPEGELTGAISAMTSYLCGEPEDLKIQRMEQLKALTPESLLEYAEAYRGLTENGRRFTVGSESVIREQEELFDAVLTPFQKQDGE